MPSNIEAIVHIVTSIIEAVINYLNIKLFAFYWRGLHCFNHIDNSKNKVNENCTFLWNPNFIQLIINKLEQEFTFYTNMLG
jgi:hypothetical protein